MRSYQLAKAAGVLALAAATSSCREWEHGRETIRIKPGWDIQAVVDSSPAGSHFLLAAGIHRYQGPIGDNTVHIRPRTGDTFRGEPGAVLRGSVELEPEAFRREGRWFCAPWSLELSESTRSQGADGYQGARWREDLFVDDQPLWQVESLPELDAPGEWFHDRTGDRICLAFDPAGQALELSLVRMAFTGSADSVVIRGLVIEKYAGDAQEGGIHSFDTGSDQAGRGWLIEDCEVRHCHGVGIKVAAGATIRHCRVHHNGQLGLAVFQGHGALIEGCEVAWNNYAGYDPSWESGGSKFVGSFDLTVRDSHFHHNLGPGIWFDIDNRDCLIENNLVHDNSQDGIAYEISYRGTIRGNTVYHNGRAKGNWAGPAGIMISASPDCVVCGNRVWGNFRNISLQQQQRGSGRFGPWQVRNTRVHDNQIGWEPFYSRELQDSVAARYQYVGGYEDTGLDSIFTPDWDNRFFDNVYQDTTGISPFLWRWGWNGRPLTLGEWQRTTVAHDRQGYLTSREEVRGE